MPKKNFVRPTWKKYKISLKDKKENHIGFTFFPLPKSSSLWSAVCVSLE